MTSKLWSKACSAKLFLPLLFVFFLYFFCFVIHLAKILNEQINLVFSKLLSGILQYLYLC